MDTSELVFDVASEPFEHYVDPGGVAAFALAINDDNPRYADGRAVPPTYAAVPGLPAFWASAQLPAKALVDGRGAGHGEHDLRIHKLPEPGTVLTTTASVASAVVNRAGMNVFRRVASVDEAGDLVYEQFWSTMFVGPATGGNAGNPLDPHLFGPDADARAREVGTRALPTTADQTFRYGGASGDRSIIHIDDRSARRAMGSERGKFMQGLGTLGIASRALVELTADGDPNRIRRIAVRFSRYAYPGDDVVVTVYDVGTTANGRHVYAFEATAGGQDVLKHGLVEITPAS